MKNISLIIWAILFTLAMSLTSLAGDYAELKFIGFSADGKYLAFEQFGEWDVYSGGDYATTYFVDVAKNIYAVAPSVYAFSENDAQHTGRFSQQAKFRRYQQSVTVGMKRFKIVGGNRGKLVVAHLDTDHSFEKPVMKEIEITQSDGSLIKKMMPFYEGDSLLPSEYNRNKIVFNPTIYPVNPDFEKLYELELKHISADKPCETRGIRVDTSMLELTIKEVDHQTESPLQILQRDKTLPAIRECPYAYHIEQVFFYKDSLAVFINIYTMGFPGSTMRYMVVTGGVNDENIK